MSNVISLRARRLDNFNLASEISRHAAVMARALSYAENETDSRHTQMWMDEVPRMEVFFIEEVDEAQRRLESLPYGEKMEFIRYLKIFGSTSLLGLEVSA